MNSKLIKELPDLVRNNVISQEVATTIEAYYQSQQANSPNRLFTVFGVLGSLLVGLGIILILAHNWDNFSRTVKTGFAFLPLIIGQLVVAFSILKHKSKTWKEASGTFLFFTIGSSIALVSQIYNIPGDLSAYVLTWVLLSAPLIYLLKSNVLAILHLIFITFYAYEIGYGHYYSNETPWLYLVLLGIAIPHYIQLLKHRTNDNITSLFNWLYPLSVTIVLGTFVKDLSELGFLMYVLLFSVFYNLGKMPFFDTQKLRKNGYLIFGSLGIVVLMLIMSFDSFWYIEELVFFAQESYISILLFFVNGVILGLAYYKKWLQSFNVFQYVFILLSLLYLGGLNLPVLGTVIINILILALGITTIKIGADKVHFGILNYGLFIITALVVCRFFDTNMSFVIRGLLFVGVGLSFFLTNYIMLKKQSSKAKTL
ncbi:DUF2157 domain-containing protein [Psychroserpens mesophilus]|uniref:DUF2157 domain-containing protein n=1 Tax=Psychroserpens mesophilus TaxID=325473 RepID=UPI003D6542A5